MVASLLIFAGISVLLTLIVWQLIKSESEDIDVEERLKQYGSSTKFQAFYKKNPYRKLSKVIKLFEKQFPNEAQRMVTERASEEEFFHKNRDRYNYLIFKYYDELKELRSTGAMLFTKDELQQVFDLVAIKSLLDAHVINFFNNKYVLQEKYKAEHPFEVDETGVPLKIEI